MGNEPNYNAGKWAVKDVIKRLINNKKLFAKQYIPADVEMWGDGDYNGSDYIYINDVKYYCPDIEVYKHKDSSEIIIRVEVKSFQKFPTNSKIPSISNYVCIKEFFVKEYLKVQKLEEIPCRVVFVIGNKIDGVSNYYYESLTNMVENIDYIRTKHLGIGDKFESYCYFWNVNDLLGNF